MKPISQDRVDFIVDRLKVIDACLQVGFSHMSQLQPGGQRNDLQTALQKFSTEKSELTIEHFVLTTKFTNMLKAEVSE